MNLNKRCLWFDLAKQFGHIATENSFENSWLQVDVGNLTRIIGVITQGRPEMLFNDWVASYKIFYGNSTSELMSIKKQNSNEELVSEKRVET